MHSITSCYTVFFLFHCSDSFKLFTKRNFSPKITNISGNVSRSSVTSIQFLWPLTLFIKSFLENFLQHFLNGRREREKGVKVWFKMETICRKFLCKFHSIFGTDTLKNRGDACVCVGGGAQCPHICDICEHIFLALVQIFTKCRLKWSIQHW